MSAAALYVYDEFPTEGAARAEAAKLAHRGAVVKPLKSRGTWNVLVTGTQPQEARLVSFQAIREAYEVQDVQALEAAEAEAAENGREHIVRHGHAGYESFRYNFRPYSEYSTEKAPEWIIRGVLPKAELAIIYGESGAGKSNLALDMAGAVSVGAQWCGRKTRKLPVGIFAGEAGAGLKYRAKAYKIRHPEVSDGDMPRIESAGLDMRDPKQVAELMRTIKAQGIGLCYIDTLASVTAGCNENSGEHMGLVLENCRTIYRNTGATVALIHHAGHSNTDRARGWSGIRAAADCEIEVSREGDYRHWRVAKMRDGKDDDIRGSFKLDVVEVGTDEDFEPVTSCVVTHVEPPPGSHPKHKERTGANERVVLEAIRTAAPVGTVAVEDVIEAFKKKMPRSSAKDDDRRKLANRAIRSLIAKGLAHIYNDDELSLTALVTGDAEPF